MHAPAALATGGHLNPTLAVEAYFMVPVDGDLRRTQFPLRDHPDVAAWLLSFLDYFLARQGRMPGNPGIAEPPGGRTRQALVEGGVILSQPRPDGGQALTLNTNMEMGLYVRARRRGQAALDTFFGLAEDPGLTRWLLTEYVRGAPPRPPAGISDTLAASLRRIAALVDELPAADACYPDPDHPADLAEELACMSRAWFQRAGQAIPPEVQALLGEHHPALPPETDIIWAQDAGTGMVYPVAWPRGLDEASVLAVLGRDATARAAQWQQQRQAARESLRVHNYCVLGGILAPAQRESLRRYVRQLMDRGYFPDLGVGDTQVALRRSIHKEPTIAALHHGLSALVSDICDQPLTGSFCQLGVYEAGAVLDKHTDRPQCVRNLSFIFDMQGPRGEPEPWPLYFEVDGKAQAVMLRAGDGAVYCGTSTPHWRDALAPEHRAVAAFYFFVPPDFRGTRN